MLDVTPRALGALFAFVLPGSVAFYALGYWFSEVRHVLNVFLTPRANFSLFLLVLMISLLLGLIAHGLRSLAFEVVPGWIRRQGASRRRPRRRRRTRHRDEEEASPPDLRSRGEDPPPRRGPSYGALREPDVLAAFRETVDQTYRYHGFFGGMAVVFPLFMMGLIHHLWGTPQFGSGDFAGTIVAGVILEATFIVAGATALTSYRQHSREILGG
ncbi:MAG: hypothetical protein ACJ77A_17980 [Actinomycetota bacterium]